MHTMTLPSLITFGSLSSVPDHDYLCSITSALLQDSNTATLVEAINALPEWWDTITQSHIVLQKVPGYALLERLRQWLIEGARNGYEEPAPNVLLAPLTIVTHLVEYLSYLRTVSTKHTKALEAAHIGGFQGLCIGQLSAYVLASASNERELMEQAAVAIRLAVLIGATVDLDGCYAEPPMEWTCVVACRKSGLPSGTFAAVLAEYPETYVSAVSGPSTTTLTLPQRDLLPVTTRLETEGFVVKNLHIRGRFHASVHGQAVLELHRLCDARPELQFQVPLQSISAVWSGSDGKPMTTELSHRQIINDVVLSPSTWHNILSAKMQAVQDMHGEILSVGRDNAIPDTMARAYGVKIQQAHRYLLHHDSHRTSPVYPEHAVAVVGMGCKFPGAASTNELWEVLKLGQVMASKVPADRFPSELWGNFVEDVASFDHKFFGKSPREAMAMDPQQRILLEVAYQAVESAGWFGIPGGRPLKEDVGCFIGCGSSDYNDNMGGHAPGAFSILGALRGLLSGRISHHFGWGGPSVTYDAACASSMAAIHGACQALQLRECDAAIAGGVNVLTSPNYYKALDAAGFLSKTGPSRAFEARADGYCRGEGAGLVVLKRLDDALAHGDNIMGIISGTAIMQNQSDATINVPSVASQVKLFRGVLDRAQLDPTQISFVEAHGTGTQVGDCIEADSVRQVFGSGRTSRLYLGSLKDNIGHTEGAAGIAGLIKALLMMSHHAIIPQPSFERLNPKIAPLEANNIEIPRRLQPWATEFRAACVNNYGAGGCNGALIVCQYSPVLHDESKALASSTSHYPIFISAKSTASLRKYCRKLKQWLESQQTLPKHGQLLADLAFCLSRTQNRELEYAVAFIANDVSDLCRKLGSYTIGTSGTALRDVISLAEAKTRPVVLVFGGQTGRHGSLSLELVQSCTLLRSHLLDCDRVLQQLGHAGIFPSIFEDINIQNRDLVNSHSVLFSIQYATARCWLDCGLHVTALLGHSFGQLTALCVSGVLSLEDALKFVAGRASLIQAQWGTDHGAMVAIEAESPTLSRLLHLVNSTVPDQKVEVACYNGPTSFVIAGGTSAIKSVGQVAANLSASIKTKILDVPYAFHTSLTVPILPGLAALAEELHYHAPRIRIETCSENASWSSMRPAMLVQHTRSPVFFGEATKRIETGLGSCTWLEAGHGSPVISMVQRSLSNSGASNHVFHPLRLESSGRELASISIALAEQGRHASFWPFHPSESDRYHVLNLPPYQFERNDHWLPYIDAAFSAKQLKNSPRQFQYFTFEGFADNGRQTAIFRLDLQSERLQLLVKGHAVLDTPLCPASAYVDIVSQAAAHLYGIDFNSAIPQLEDLRVEAPLGLDNSRHITLSLTQIPDVSNGWSFLFESAKKQTANIIHARGKVHLRTAGSAQPSAFSSFDRLVDASAPEQLLKDCHAQTISGPVIYGLFGKTVTYDSFYRGLRKVASTERETAASIILPRPELTTLSVSPCDPIAMDNFLQVAGIHVNFLQEALNDEVFVASQIDNIMFGSESLLSGSASEWLVYSKCSPRDDRTVTSDIFAFSLPTRQLTLMLLGVRFTRVHTTILTKILRGANSSKDGNKSAVVNTSDLNQHSALTKPIEDTRSAPKDSKKHALLCALLGELLDVPIEQVTSKTTLADLGIDSLMMTEVASSIGETFGITIATAELQTLENVKALSHRLFVDLNGTSSFRASSSLVRDGENSSSGPTPTPSASTATSSLNPEFTTQELPSVLVESDSKPFPETFRKISQQFDIFAAQHSFLGYWETVYPSHSRLVLVYIVDALSALGCSLRTLSPGSLLPDVAIHVRHHMLYSRLLEILQEHGIVHQKPDGTFRRSSQTIETTTPAMLHAHILQQYPAYDLEHRLLGITGQRLAECLKGDVDAVDLLFGSKSNRELLQNVYSNAPIFKTATSLLANFLVNSLRSSSPMATIRILEIGAGTGGTTMFLMNALLRARINFTYTFTDLSPSLVSKARQKFSGFDNMQFQVLDIEQAVPSELRGQFQVIVSTNCIHATPDIVASCQNIRQLLNPTGFVALVELTRKMAWFDVVFGLLEGWWAFTDDRTHALVDEQVWDKSLRAADFQHVEWSSGESKESNNIRIICGFKQNILNLLAPSLASTPITSTYKATALLIQASTSRCARKIFAFPGGFGTAATYTPLPVLATSVEVYGLNSPFLKSPSTFNVSLGELTRIYLDEITRVQPTGPYTLMGYSVGGVMAYEAARQLMNEGEEVCQLILLDSACPSLIPPFPLSLLDFFDGIDRFKGTGEDAQDSKAQGATEAKSSANTAKKMADPHVVATLQSLHKYDPIHMPSGRSPHTLLIAARHGIDRLRRVLRPEVNDVEQKVIEWALDDRSDFTPSGFGWDRLIDADMIEVVPVDGNHFSLMTEPFISRVADMLRKHVGIHGIER
ncbi:hypothetical protein CC86DRAFT_346125 [Ophiobolus disseminans]|uniref:Uncharacterized protein n=1 Tax=Ophiobolus disseminans TaxID=1469910 RepID=A0A6A7A9R1_9PLEO|nr:hypothetical protein CC86DRAFT_346125 [Ophiobolus disseminans]